MKGKSAERPANDAVAKDILAGLAEAQRGDFATEDEVAAVIAKYVKRAHIAIASLVERRAKVPRFARDDTIFFIYASSRARQSSHQNCHPERSEGPFHRA